MNPFTRLSLVQRFLLTGGIVFAGGMAAVGAWVAWQIEAGVVNRTGAVTSTFVDSFVSPHLQSLAHADRLRDADGVALDQLLSGTPLGRQIVAFKVWRRDGTVLYGSNAEIVGRNFPVKPALAAAFEGKVSSRVADLHDPENFQEARRWPRLIETYVPVRAPRGPGVLAVAEFYQTFDDLAADLQEAQRRSWLAVGAATLAMFLLLAGLVKRANDTIVGQQKELHEKLDQLTALLAQNERLHERVRRAAARTTALNERVVHRIAADLHDGPGQAMALALMRMETLSDACSSCPAAIGRESSVGEEFRTVRAALQNALDDMRAISAEMRLPEIEPLSLEETARRAVRDYERKTAVRVPLAVDGVPLEAPLPVKITLFRLIQESLANGYRHGDASNQRVALSCSDDALWVEVADNGTGFDPGAAISAGHLGLSGMRERVEILAGSFNVRSALGEGTVIRASLPMRIVERDGE